MKFTTIDEPNYSVNDEVTIKIFSPFVSEVTKKQVLSAKDYDPHTNSRSYKFKNTYKICKELKTARETILTNISPEDLPYAYFITYTKKGLNYSNIEEAWNSYKSEIERRIGLFEYVAVFEKGSNGNLHIHTIIFDPNHSDNFEKINYRLFRFSEGNVSVRRISSFDHLISIAYYITKTVDKETKRNKYNNKEIPSVTNLFNVSSGLTKTPLIKQFEEADITDMECKFSTSYRLNNSYFDCNFTRSLYTKIA